MQDSDDDQASRRNAAPSNNKARHSHPRSQRKVQRNSGDDTDGELNDGYGEDYSAHHPSRSSHRSNNRVGRGGKFDEDAEFFGTSPMNPLNVRMNRKAPSTLRNHHYQQQDVYHQNERGIYPGEDDAVANGAGCSAKDGSQYIRKTRQEGPTTESVEDWRTTRKAKQSVRQQSVTTTSIERPRMPSNIGARNNGSPTNHRRQQNQKMGAGQQWQHAGRSEEYNVQVTSNQRRAMLYNDGAANTGSSISRHTEQHQKRHQQNIKEPSQLRPQPPPSLSSAQASLQHLTHQQHVFRQQHLQPQQYDQQQHMHFASNPFHSSPQQQQQQWKRPHTGDYSQSGTPHSSYRQNHISNPPHSNYYFLSPIGVQIQPIAFIPYHHQSPTAHNTTQVMVPIQVQSQFQPTPMLQRDISDSTLASVEQPLHLLPSLPPSDHQPITASATRKKKTSKAEYETRIESARIAYGGSDGWCRLYRDVPFGMLPTKEQLKAHHPPSAMQLLLFAPINKGRADDEVGHFFEKQSLNDGRLYPYNYKHHHDSNDDSDSDDSNSNDSDSDDSDSDDSDSDDSDSDDSDSDDKPNKPNSNKGKAGRNRLPLFRCQMTISPATDTQPELRCGKPYAICHGVRSRTRHLDKVHPGVRTAVSTFRHLQLKVQHPEKLFSDVMDDADRPVCECGIAGRDQQRFSELLINLISETSISMDTIQDKTFKKLMNYLNPTLDVQDSDTLRQLLEKKPVDIRGDL